MKTEEAIHKIRYWLTFYVEGIHEEAMSEAIKQVENSLQRGEKYEKMWESLKYNMCRMADYDVKQNWLDTVYKYEQKYFPKESNNVSK